MSAEPVAVAVGVLIRPDGRFLLAQRPSGKPMAGYWEFPGGKLEAGEDVLTALRREFLEELGLSIQVAVPWAVRVFRYPHATVRLHFWRVYRWQGEPEGREGQAFRWEQIEAPLVEPWLPGALALRRWLTLPDYYAISRATELGIAEFLTRLDARVARGDFKLLQLREPQLDEATFLTLFREVRARASDCGFKLLVNSTHPEKYWSLGHGVHLTEKDLFARSQRPSTEWCAASCHDARAIGWAGEIGADFAVLGPVLATASHPHAKALGWSGFGRACSLTQIPVYALGGLGHDNLDQALGHGAQGIAAIRDAWR